MKLMFVGDVMLGRMVNEHLKTAPPESVWGDTLPIIKSADAAFCNLECVVADNGEAWGKTPKRFHFRSNSKNIAVLGAAGIDAVSIANNHVLDFGEEAMREETELLTKAGIKFAGAGANLEAAMEPAIWDPSTASQLGRAGKIGFLAFTDNEPGWAGQKNRPGTFYVDVEGGKTKELIKRVKEARKETDLLIVSAHWGSNWGYQPAKEHVELAHKLVEAGADIVYGHSAHVCRGVEIYKSKVIIYGAGDFIDDYAIDGVERNDFSLIFGIEEIKGKIEKVYFYPTVIRQFSAQMARGGEQAAIRGRMESLCQDLGTKTSWSGMRGRLEVIF